VTTALQAALVEAAPRLTAQVLAEMYENPFWEERFGARGRTHAKDDGNFHIQYLLQALDAGDDHVFVEYARWLREVLVARGMCSLHLIENFDRLGRAIAREGWLEGDRAVAILAAGSRALAYETGEAAAIDRARATLAAAVARVVPVARGEHEVAEYLSFLADALAFAEPARFASFLEHTAAAHRARGRAPNQLRETLSILETTLRTTLGAPVAVALISRALETR
jgi:hypothetical protein